MKRVLALALGAGFVVASFGCPPPPAKLAAKIVSFTGQLSGADATLSWETQNATAVSVKDSTGKAIDGATQPSGTW